MGLATTEKEWADRVARFLKAELKRADLTYEQLAERLKAHGFEESKSSISSKFFRATISAAFLLACIAALGLTGIDLEDL